MTEAAKMSHNYTWSIGTLEDPKEFGPCSTKDEAERIWEILLFKGLGDLYHRYWWSNYYSAEHE